MSGLRLLYRRATGLRCVHWPCRRCDRAGRTSWRSREQWHRGRRRRVIPVVMAVLLVLPGVLWVAL